MADDIVVDIDFDIIEGSATETTADGTTVNEAITAIVDEETGEALVDAAVEVVAPDGSVVRDETLSMVEADGTVTVLAEDIEESD